jgi:Golgi apparatus protein 1
VLNCLLNELHDEQEKGGKGLRLAERCKNLLQKRTALYQKAGAVGKMEFLQDLIDQVQISPHKSYFLSVTMALVGLIFIFGLFCGRATHKRTASKNK